MDSSRFENKLILGFVILIPLTIAARLEFIDPFTYSTATLAWIYQQQGHIVVNPFKPLDFWQYHANEFSVRPTAAVWLVFISEMTSLPIQSLIFLPIMGFVYVLLAYTLATEATGSRVFGVLYALIQSWDIQVILATLNSFYIPLGYTLAVLFVILYLRISPRSPRKSNALALLVFPSVVLTYYTSEFLAISFGLSLFLIQRMRTRSKVSYGPSAYLLLTLVMSALAFESALFAFWTSIFNPSTAQVVVLGYLTYVLGLTTRAGGEFQRYASGSSRVPILYISDFVYRILLGLSTLAYIPLWFTMRRFRKAIISLKRTTILIESILLTVSGYIFMYSMVGLFNLRLVYLFIPLAVLLVIRTARLGFPATRFVPRLASLITILLIGLVLFRFGAFLIDTSHPYGAGAFSAVTPGISFLVAHTTSDDPKRALSDLGVSGQLFYVSSLRGSNSAPVLSDWFMNNSAVLYTSNPGVAYALLRSGGYSFLLFSHVFESRAISLDGYEWGPPAVRAIKTLSYEPGINVIYNDDNMVIFAVNP